MQIWLKFQRSRRTGSNGDWRQPITFTPWKSRRTSSWASLPVIQKINNKIKERSTNSSRGVQFSNVCHTCAPQMCATKVRKKYELQWSNRVTLTSRLGNSLVVPALRCACRTFHMALFPRNRLLWSNHIHACCASFGFSWTFGLHVTWYDFSRIWE